MLTHLRFKPLIDQVHYYFVGARPASTAPGETGSAAPSEHERFTTYLQGLRDRGVQQAQVGHVRQVWGDLLSKAGRMLSLPVAGLTDEGAFQFAWNSDTAYAEIDVLPDGTVDWFV